MRRNFLPILFLGIASVSSYFVFASRIPNELQVSFLDVGQGDAIFIQSPSGIQVLVDGGPDASVVEELHKVMPLFDKSIDLVIATHPDADHINGLTDVVKRFDVSAFLESGGKNENGVQEKLEDLLTQRNIPKKLARRGQEYDLGGGAVLSILYPYTDVSKEESNAGSIVMQLVYGEDSFMLTGDAPITSEFALVGTDGDKLRSTVLKFGHHGSDTSSSLPFLEKVRPVYGVVSAGKNNRYGHPDQDVLDRASRFETVILQTLKSGTITFSTNGKGIEVLNLLEDSQAKTFE